VRRPAPQDRGGQCRADDRPQRKGEQGRAPAAIVASRIAGGRVERTRPVCPYPQVVRYKGTGPIDRAESFACAMP